MTTEELAQARLEKARELMAEMNAEQGYGDSRGYLAGNYDLSVSIRAFVKHLDETNWHPPEPPEDPDERAVEILMNGRGYDRLSSNVTFNIALTAYKAGKAAGQAIAGAKP